MNFFERFLLALDGKMKTPALYGCYHLLSFSIVIIFICLICIKFKNCSYKTFRKICLISWILLVVFEIYKQLIYSFEYNGIEVVWNYKTNIVPLQLCSSILYMLPFVIFLKDGKVKDCFIAYLISFSLFGGIAVMFYPGDVFTTSIGVNIQTMIHHGIQVLIGIFLLIYNRYKLNLKFFFKALPVFAVFVTVVMLVNVLLAGRINMMYISPYLNSNIPIAKELYTIVPYFVYFLIMMAFYIGAGFVTYLLVLYLIKNLKLKEKITKTSKIQKE